ncbi:Mannan endo-1,6-alpha-mannosidase DCW1 [Neonectria ditissima]|uniref:mannan endo-1,6-alpha-mannosidase n=1 Tax=Neonectria ditissima TaxID=78410 RepID=A0A0P7ATR9_9HYPO|nr:Mannan endo-1,6-alpha-mannosidase DCW1 [Neonectria ditissima]
MFPTSGSEPRLGFGGLVAALLLALSSAATAFELDPNSTQSVKKIAKTMVADLMSFYKGDEPGHTPGLLPDPYYWWEAGAMMGSLIEYWHYTKDDTYVNVTKEGLLYQVGEHDDYMPINQTRTEGNDDQGFWGLAVMSAAEYNFPHPKADEPQWLALAQAVFNTQAARWDTEHCGGGLRWQIFQWNNGYNYKNSISQACFFALGARLALFTGNQTYADWSDKTWDWMEEVEFINKKNWAVYDGAHIETGCTNIVPYQFSYNAGGFILGAAAMYNYTESEVWKERLDNLIEGVKVFFSGPNKNIMTEVACEPVKLCNVDQQSFKAYLSRWLAVTTQWAPHTAETIIPLLKTSAVAAAKQCVGGDNGHMCGMIWNKDKYDGTTGVGQQMSSLEVTLSCIVQSRGAPMTADNGGTSKGDAGAGSEDIGRTEPDRHWKKITAGDRAGAAILTALFIGVFISGLGWVMVDESSDKSAVEQFRGFLVSTYATVAAFVGFGGAAAALHQRDSNVVREKAAAGAYSSGDGSSRGSGDHEVSNLPPVMIRNVRNQEPSQHRRMSSMPIGWPHNRSMRGSILFDPNGIHPASGRQSRSDLANTPKMSDFSPADLSSTGRHSLTSESTPPIGGRRRSADILYDSTTTSELIEEKHQPVDGTEATENNISNETSQNTEADHRPTEINSLVEEEGIENKPPSEAAIELTVEKPDSIEEQTQTQETGSTQKEKETSVEILAPAK